MLIVLAIVFGVRLMKAKKKLASKLALSITSSVKSLPNKNANRTLPVEPTLPSQPTTRSPQLGHFNEALTDTDYETASGSIKSSRSNIPVSRNDSSSLHSEMIPTEQQPVSCSSSEKSYHQVASNEVVVVYPLGRGDSRVESEPTDTVHDISEGSSGDHVDETTDGSKDNDSEKDV